MVPRKKKTPKTYKILYLTALFFHFSFFYSYEQTISNWLDQMKATT